MASLVTAVLKCTIGALVNKGRTLAAEKLKDGDVADARFRQLIVREMDDIKSKLDGIAGKDLAASISFFNDGVVHLGKVLDEEIVGKDEENEADGATKRIVKAEEKTVSLVKGMKILQLVGLNEDATKAITEAKKRFEDARREAVKAFGNTALSTSDRLLAMAIRIMATVLEQVDNPASALASCRLCLEELHSLPAVQENFGVVLKKGIKSKFGKDRRNEIIAAVCQINRIIYDFTQMVVDEASKARELLTWPCVKVGEEKIDPLRDARIAATVREMGMEQCCVQPWSFGQEGEEEQSLEDVRGIAINTKGQFIIIVGCELVKLFDNSGRFLYSFSSPAPDDDAYCMLNQDVASDHIDNMYLLVRDLKRNGTVHVFDPQAKLHHSFNTRPGYEVHSLTVDSSRNVLVSMSEQKRPDVSEEMYYRNHDLRNMKELMVEVHDNNGQRLHTIDDVFCHSPRNCLCTISNGHVMVLDASSNTLHLFGNKENYPLEKKIQLKEDDWRALTFHQASEQLFIASFGKDGISRVSLYSKDGEYVRTIPLDVGFEVCSILAISVTNDGHIVLVLMRPFDIDALEYKSAVWVM